jgi:hypothetical protein
VWNKFAWFSEQTTSCLLRTFNDNSSSVKGGDFLQKLSNGQPSNKARYRRIQTKTEACGAPLNFRMMLLQIFAPFIMQLYRSDTIMKRFFFYGSVQKTKEPSPWSHFHPNAAVLFRSLHLAVSTWHEVADLSCRPVQDGAHSNCFLRSGLQTPLCRTCDMWLLLLGLQIALHEPVHGPIFPQVFILVLRGHPSGLEIVKQSLLHAECSLLVWYPMWLCKNRRFGGMYRLHQQGDKNQRARNNGNNFFAVCFSC